jgi:hypothetical protein
LSLGIVVLGVAAVFGTSGCAKPFARFFLFPHWPVEKQDRPLKLRIETLLTSSDTHPWATVAALVNKQPYRFIGGELRYLPIKNCRQALGMVQPSGNLGSIYLN